MYSTSSIESAESLLGKAYAARFGEPKNGEGVAGPVGIFLVQDDGSAAASLVRSVVTEMDYWNDLSQLYFDAVFLGWGLDSGHPVFLRSEYAKCESELVRRTKLKASNSPRMIVALFRQLGSNGVPTIDFSNVVCVDLGSTALQNSLQKLLLGQVENGKKAWIQGEPENAVPNASLQLLGLVTARRLWGVGVDLVVAAGGLTGGTDVTKLLSGAKAVVSFLSLMHDIIGVREQDIRQSE